jgi:hypothetical protein
MALNDRYRILSFADARDNAHLWNDYAATFSGVCLEFNFDKFFTTVYGVSYHDTLDAMDITYEIGFSNLKTSALIKTTPWRFKSECRVIAADPPVSGDELRIVNDRIYFGGQLTGIVFGERTTREHIDEYLRFWTPPTTRRFTSREAISRSGRLQSSNCCDQLRSLAPLRRLLLQF